MAATFQEEQNKLLESYLERYEKHTQEVEFFLSSTCDQACEYCYLFKHGKELYPPSCNDDSEKILNNLKLLLEYLHENNYDYKNYNIFTGEFFALPYWEEVLQIFYDYHMKYYPDLDRNITIPTNGSFLKDEEKVKKIEPWLAKLRREHGSPLHLFLSMSVDGPHDLELRTRHNKVYKKDKADDVFYDRLFKLCDKYKFACHPMVTKYFLQNWKENYDWWIDKCVEYNLKFIGQTDKEIYNIPMFLEVRDPYEWEDEETIQQYKDFLMYVAEKDLKVLHNNDKLDFARRVLNSDSITEGGDYGNAQPYIIAFPHPWHRITCSIQGGPMFRIGDLALIPCHRTGYENLTYGHMKVNDEGTKIIGVEAKKPVLAFKIKTLNPNRSMLKCSNCQMRSWCLKGCLGSQFENQRELFSPNDYVCNMFFTKYKTIHEICEKYDLYRLVLNDEFTSEDRKEYIKNARKILQQL